MSNKPVVIEEHNYNWPIIFNGLATILKAHLGGLIIDIEHVGSTSVPGLAAKPIIDLDIVVDSMTNLSEIIDKLSELGYYHEGNLGIEGREAFGRIDGRVPYDQSNQLKQEHHLYVCNNESEAYTKHIRFRDLLRRNPKLANEYAMLKKKLATQYKYNRQAYTEGKTQFVVGALERYNLQ
ncbi:GrpB family protein [Cohnella sp. 56]|uniref:GrpB family protein n=1 Tax=Cohnella sp. 56 TaxID=3113722 RepID=UPI0030E9370B